MKRGTVVATTLLCTTHCCFAVTYYVSTTGNDTNSGNAEFPWRTIQKAADTVLAGDATIVLAGLYDERVTTKRGGSNEASRILFKAEGTATLRGFSVGHPYVTITGFDIAHHSATNPLTGYIEISGNGDYFQIISNTFRDGISVVRSDLVFTNAPTNTISSATGGFTNAGFQAGMSLNVLKAAKQTLLSNAGPYTIHSVTDNAITLAQALNNQGPILACLDASINYGLVVNQGADFGLVQGNVFSNLDYHAVYALGNNNVYEHNTFVRCNGWNVFYFNGTNNVARRNVVRDSPLKQFFNLSPNLFINFGNNATYQVRFENNFIQGYDGVVVALSASTNFTLRDIVFYRNVFVNAGPGVIKLPNIAFINNTFYGVAAGPTDGVQAVPHALQFQSNGGALNQARSAEGAIVKNNIFVGCGNQPQNTPSNGWYQFLSVTNYVADYDFVSGAATNFAAKAGFAEANGLNGGDPGFVNLSDPLGPDGIPFTADDGLRLLADSVLRGQGEDGVDLGAYITSSASFNASPTNGVAPLTVTFTDASTGANTNWFWDFGDGGTSGSQSPGYTYSNAGVYTVSLTVSGDDGTSSLIRTNLIAVLTPLQSWQLLYFGCTNCAQALVEADPDGDGQNNQAEFLSGTDPTNGVSALRIISVVQEDSDVNIAWQTAGSRTNAVQAAASSPTGDYTNDFADISPMIITGSGDTTTNYTDVGGATNEAARFYRVRLVP